MANFFNQFIPDENTLRDKHILITGASSEVGSSVCYGAARAGATVLMLDRKQRSMVPLYDKICANGWPEPMMIEFDTKSADEASISQLSSAVAGEISALDGLVHCAMWGAPLSPVVNSNVENWQTILTNQLIKPMIITKSLVGLLSEAEHSSIVFTSLDVGRTGRAYWGGVATAFAGIENLSEIMSDELQSQCIRVNTVDPGKVKTTLRKQFYPGETAEKLRDANHPEIVNGYLYLLSDKSLDETGQRFTVPSL